MTASRPESTRTSIREVAAAAGVSISSVSRVLSGHHDVSDRMRDRVTAAATALAYEPDEIAQVLRSGASNTIGFVIADISNPAIAPIVLGAEVYLRGKGMSTFITNSERVAQRDVEHIKLLRRRRVDGLLLSLSDETYEPTAEAIASAGLPVVLIDRDLPSALGCSSVLIDHGAGVRQAVQHVAELGHRKIGMIIGPSSIRPNRERVKALRLVARRSGLTFTLSDGNVTADEAGAAASEMLDLDDAPTVIIAGANQMLAGILRVIRDRGISMPDDLSLVTCDDVPLLEFVHPPLATIVRDLRGVGESAARLLIEQINGAEPRRIVARAGFDARSSCGPPRR